MQVLVRDNNVDQALKALKKKMQREGIFREMKLRGHYEKPPPEGRGGGSDPPAPLAQARSAGLLPGFPASPVAPAQAVPVQAGGPGAAAAVVVAVAAWFRRRRRWLAVADRADRTALTSLLKTADGPCLSAFSFEHDLAHVLVGEPVPTSPGHGARYRSVSHV